MGIWTGLGWPRIETGVESCKCGSEPLVSVKWGEFLD